MKYEILRNLNLSIKCPHQTIDNKGYINCTKNDNTIGYCTNPCPYKNPLHPQLPKYSYIPIYAFSKPYSLREARIKLCYRVFAYSYIFIEAVEGDSYEW